MSDKSEHTKAQPATSGQNKTSQNVSTPEEKHIAGSTLRAYWPLFSLVVITAAAAGAITWNTGGGFTAWMHYFMGFFLCCFGMLKIFDPGTFADGFQMYDLIARHSRFYAYLYPYLELGLGLGFLSFTAPGAVYAATFILMLTGATGVFLALRRGLNINCPCLGSVLKVPLSTVTLTEDLAMSAMAALMLAKYIN